MTIQENLGADYGTNETENVIKVKTPSIEHASSSAKIWKQIEFPNVKIGKFRKRKV